MIYSPILIDAIDIFKVYLVTYEELFLGISLSFYIFKHCCPVKVPDDYYKV